MTNLERNPQEVLCTEAIGAGAALLTPRDVPLGGPRAMTVRRTPPSAIAVSSARGASWTTTAPIPWRTPGACPWRATRTPGWPR